MKTYHDIKGDGGSRILEQVADQRSRIIDGLAGVRHLVAVGSGKGGVARSKGSHRLLGYVENMSGYYTRRRLRRTNRGLPS